MGKPQSQHPARMTVEAIGEDDGERWFDTVITADVVDRQGEVLDPAGFTLKEYRDILKAPIIDTHSNITVGRFKPDSLRYGQVEDPSSGKMVNAILGRGVIFQAPKTKAPDGSAYEQYPVWDEVWEHVKSKYEMGTPSGVSIGGDPDPVKGKQVRCDADSGKCHIFVPKVYWYETSVVRDGKGPANPVALNSGINAMAKGQHPLNKTNDFPGERARIHSKLIKSGITGPTLAFDLHLLSAHSASPQHLAKSCGCGIAKGIEEPGCKCQKRLGDVMDCPLHPYQPSFAKWTTRLTKTHIVEVESEPAAAQNSGNDPTLEEGEVAIDDDLPAADLPGTATHEAVEEVLRHAGLPYPLAHEAANAAEEALVGTEQFQAEADDADAIADKAEQETDVAWNMDGHYEPAKKSSYASRLSKLFHEPMVTEDARIGNPMTEESWKQQPEEEAGQVRLAGDMHLGPERSNDHPAEAIPMPNAKEVSRSVGAHPDRMSPWTSGGTAGGDHSNRESQAEGFVPVTIYQKRLTGLEKRYRQSLHNADRAKSPEERQQWLDQAEAESKETPHHRAQARGLKSPEVIARAQHPEAPIPLAFPKSKPSNAERITKADRPTKRKTTWNGLDIHIEFNSGDMRSGTSKDGSKWSRKMSCHYGHLVGHEGHDGDSTDVYLNPYNRGTETPVFVVNQLKGNGQFDEHKVMLGFPTMQSAQTAYKAHYPRSHVCGPIVQMSVQQFKRWLKNPNAVVKNAGSFSGGGNSGMMTTGDSGTFFQRTGGKVYRRPRKVTKAMVTSLVRSRMAKTLGGAPLFGRTEAEGMRDWRMPPAPTEDALQFDEAIREWMNGVGGPKYANDIIGEALEEEKEVELQAGRQDALDPPSPFTLYLFRLMQGIQSSVQPTPADQQMMMQAMALQAAGQQPGAEGGAEEDPEQGSDEGDAAPEGDSEPAQKSMYGARLSTITKARPSRPGGMGGRGGGGGGNPTGESTELPSWAKDKLTPVPKPETPQQANDRNLKAKPQPAPQPGRPPAAGNVKPMGQGMTDAQRKAKEEFARYMAEDAAAHAKEPDSPPSRAGDEEHREDDSPKPGAPDGSPAPDGTNAGPAGGPPTDPEEPEERANEFAAMQQGYTAWLSLTDEKGVPLNAGRSLDDFQEEFELTGGDERRLRNLAVTRNGLQRLFDPSKGQLFGKGARPFGDRMRALQNNMKVGILGGNTQDRIVVDYLASTGMNVDDLVAPPHIPNVPEGYSQEEAQQAQQEDRYERRRRQIEAMRAREGRASVDYKGRHNMPPASPGSQQRAGYDKQAREQRDIEDRVSQMTPPVSDEEWSQIPGFWELPYEEKRKKLDELARARLKSKGSSRPKRP